MTADGRGAFHLAFLPDRLIPRFFLWGRDAAASALATCGGRATALVVDETLAARELEGIAIPLLEALPRLAALTSSETDRAPASLAAWSQAAKLALELVGRERLVPRLVPAAGVTEARFGVALAVAEDAERVAALAKSFPLAAHAVPVPGTARAEGAPRRRGRVPPADGETQVWAPEALLRAFLDTTADALVRAAAGPIAPARRSQKKNGHLPWERRLALALAGPDAAFVPAGFAERSLVAELDAWTRPALGAEPGAARACFRLDLPDAAAGERRGRGRTAEAFPLRFFLQASDDPSLLVPAGELFRGRGAALRRLGGGFQAAEEHLLRALATGARLFAPIERALHEARPEAVLLDPGEAWAFLTDAAPALVDAGMGVILPAEITRSGQRRLRLRMRVGGSRRGTAGTVSGASDLGLDEVMSFRWEAALAGETLSERDL
ncbi:MAG: SNF2 helicase-associated domain-containing protein, partial [Candidatus Eisenbacteria bacterium]